MNARIKIIYSSLLLVIIFSSAQLAFAQAAPQPEDPNGLVTCGRHLDSDATPAEIKENECTLSDLLQTVVTLTNFLLSWAWLVATLVIVWAGWGMVNAGGNEEAVSAAKTTLTNGIIGFALILMSFVLLNFIVALVTGDSNFSGEKLIEAFRLVL